MATNRAPRNAKALGGKVLDLICEFPRQSRLQVATWLNGHIRTDMIPDLRAEMKKAEKEETGRSTRGASARRTTATRGTTSTAKRSAAAKKAAATRKARGTQRGGRRSRSTTQTPEIHAESPTANTAAA